VATGVKPDTGRRPGCFSIWATFSLSSTRAGTHVGGSHELLEHARRPFGDAGRAGGTGTVHPQREPGAVEPLVGAFQHPPRRELGRQAMCGGDGQAGEAGDLGERVLATFGKGQGGSR
jgi:hypothetical protein